LGHRGRSRCQRELGCADDVVARGFLENLGNTQEIIARATVETRCPDNGSHHGTIAKTSASKKPSAKKPVTVVHRSSQQQPTPDRYREIQKALADKGYFAGSPDGNWSSESVDALKRFQRDQNLTDDGKIGSLSLIAMGLGPHRPPTIETPTVEAAPSEKSTEKSPEKLSQQH
jgi:hypothetical protein